LPQEAYPKGKEAALKALEIDNALGEAYISLAHSKLFYDWDWAGAASDIERGLRFSPNYPDAHGFYGAYLTAMGRLDEALRERKRAQELDSLSPFTNLGVGWVHFYARRWDEAIENYRRAVELDPTFITPHNDLGNTYSMKGMYYEAVEEYLKAKAIGGEKPEAIAALRQAYAASGIKGYWQKELEMANERLKQGGVGSYRMARIYAALDDKDRAFEWLEKAFEGRNSLMVFIKVVPTFDDLHSDPRFASLMGRIGLSP
jgi:tetratricopeptide (TPR) repeat protein